MDDQITKDAPESSVSPAPHSGDDVFQRVEQDGRKGRRNGSKKPVLGRLLEQFYRTMETSFIAAKQDGITDGQAEIAKRIEALLVQQPESWQTIYEVEQLLVRVCSPAALDREISRRIVESQEILPKKRRDYYQAITSAKVKEFDDSEKRELLSRLVNDLQWQYTQTHLKRSWIREVMSIVHQSVAGVFVLFVIFTAIFTLVPSPAFAWHLVIAALAGGVGAGFSLLMSLRRKLVAGTYEDAKFTGTSRVVRSRMTIGFVAGAIVFFFLRSGYLSGDLFPELAEDGSINDFAELSGLVVWSLIAGFSEQFIPGLLTKQSEAASGQSGTTE